MFIKHQEILADLFNAYMRRPEELPEKYRSRIDNPDTKAQTVCDYIAGMTDRFAVERHRAMTGK
jgi:dGTPase